MENESMTFLNFLGNKLFSLAFRWLSGHQIKDTLCGTKALWREDYERIASHRGDFANPVPLGNFGVLLGSGKINLKIPGIPVRYQTRTCDRRISTVGSMDGFC